ncbi:ATP-binding protein [Thermodesulfobacteriota bacterium]
MAPLKPKQSASVRLGRLLDIPAEGNAPMRYPVLRRNLLILMLIITTIPLLLMALINYYQYQSRLKDEILTPMRALVNKSKHSFELLLASRVSTVNFVASAYSFQDLADEANLHRIFSVLRAEFKGFVDIGLIDSQGTQVSYVGPYELKGKKYTKQDWFQQVRVSGTYVSKVFKGHRRFPHIVIAVQHLSKSGDRWWIVRATIDTSTFDEIISSMGLEPGADAFLVSREGILQTNSKFYGSVLDTCRLKVPPQSYEAAVLMEEDPGGREVVLAYAYFANADLVLMVVKQKGAVLEAWYTLKSEILLVFVVSLVVITLVVFWLTRRLVDRLKESDEKRELAYREMQHSHKLSSIGRLAAGVAHEINNPLAIINEKAGLMKDLIEYDSEVAQTNTVFLGQINSIVGAVDRCRKITQRLLGFARRLDVQIEILDVHDVIEEVIGFLDKEAIYRNIILEKAFSPDLKRISSDRGQLQQVFLNILNNAFAAVQDGGKISVTTSNGDVDTVVVVFEDDGCGMSEDTLRHVFEPFFTTKRGHGTGLGLSITYGIVKKLGGDIQIKSVDGEGTKLTVYLPGTPPEQGEISDERLESSPGR